MAATAAAPLVALPAKQRFGRPNWFVIILAAIMALCILAPIVSLVYGAFLNAPPGTGGSLSLKAFEEAWTDPDAWTAAWTSIWLALVRTSVVVVISVFLSWAIVRTNMPWKSFVEGVLVSHIFMPLLPLTMAWAVLASPRAGLLNDLVRGLFNLHVGSGPLNIYSYGGLIWLSALGLPSYVFLLVAPAFRSVDTSLEEAARTSGASAMRTLWRVTVPVLAPALLGAGMLMFVIAIQSFEPELILGTPAGIYVFSTQIYRYLAGVQVPQYGPATALSMLFLVITFILVLVQSRILGDREFTTVSGKSFRARPMDIGRWKYLVLVLALLFVFMSTILPLGTLILASFMHIYGFFGDHWFTTEHFQELLSSPKLGLSVINTLIISAGSATLAMFVTSAVAYIHKRTKIAGRGLLDLLTWLPLTIPGLVLGVGMTWAFVAFIKLPFHFFGSLGMLILAVTITSLPTGGRLMSGTMVQLSPELEESGRVHGASFAAVSRRVVIPLLTPALLSGWLTLFAAAVKNFAVVSVIYAPSSIVVAALQYELWNGGKPEDATALGALNMAFSLILVLIYVSVIRRRNLASG